MLASAANVLFNKLYSLLIPPKAFATIPANTVPSVASAVAVMLVTNPPSATPIKLLFNSGAYFGCKAAAHPEANEPPEYPTLPLWHFHQY